jgi:hypothetical protein
MNFKGLIEKYIKKLDEDMVSGGTGSIFSGGQVDIGSTGGEVGNKDSYAPGDTRIPFALGRKNKKHKKSKGNFKRAIQGKIPFIKRSKIQGLFLNKLNSESIEKKLPKEFKKGTKVEKEHNHPGYDPKVIAKDHLREFPNIPDGKNYYNKLDKMETILKREEKKYAKQSNKRR